MLLHARISTSSHRQLFSLNSVGETPRAMWSRTSVLSVRPIHNTVLFARRVRPAPPVFSTTARRATSSSSAPRPNLERPRATIEDALRVLKGRFGHDDFLPGQEAVISRILAGGDALITFPVSSGRSLCYLVSLVVLAHRRSRRQYLALLTPGRSRPWLKLPMIPRANRRGSPSSFPPHHCP